MSRRTRILVVGGGFTGLTAAYRLAQDARVEVSLLEKAPELGGLAAGCRLAGFPVEKTYHHLFLTDRDILDLTAELGLADRLMWHPGSTSIFIDGKLFPFNGALDLLRFTPCPPLDRLRTGAVAFYLKYLKDFRRLAGERAAAWMQRHGGAGAARTIWNPLLRGKFASHADRVSMAWLWARIHTRANSAARGGIKFGYYRGGFEVLVRALEQRLRAAGVAIATDCGVRELRPADGGGFDVTDDSGRSSHFDRVLFTGSSRAFARLVEQWPAPPADYLARLRSVPYLGAICHVFASRQALPAPFWVNINEAGAPFLVFIDLTRIAPPENFGGHHVYYIGAYLDTTSAAYQQDDAARRAEWFAYLRRIYPEFDSAQIVDEHTFRFADAQHVVTPGYEERLPAHRTPVDGLYLANFSQIYPEDRGTNFAVRDGNQLAALILGDLAAS